MKPLLSHVRSNVVAYLALFVALGGTSYAAISLPVNSVGASQIRNHTIQPVKFDPSRITGSVRIWASVSASGKVLGGGSGIVLKQTSGVPGDYLFVRSKRSRIVVSPHCATVVTVNVDPSGTPGSAEGDVATFPRGLRWEGFIQTFNAQGQRQSLPYNFAVIC